MKNVLRLNKKNMFLKEDFKMKNHQTRKTTSPCSPRPMLPQSALGPKRLEPDSVQGPGNEDMGLLSTSCSVSTAFNHTALFDANLPKFFGAKSKCPLFQDIPCLIDPLHSRETWDVGE